VQQTGGNYRKTSGFCIKIKNTFADKNDIRKLKELAAGKMKILGLK